MSEESTRNEQKDQLRKKSRRVQIYKAVFGTPDGKWVLKDLLRLYKSYGTTMVENDPNGRIHAFQEGQRSVPVGITNILTIDFDELCELYESLPDNTQYE